MRPLVSIIMAAYNAGDSIGPAIQSILAQTYDNFELIIVDDASRDNTIDVVQSFQDPRILLFKNQQNLKAGKSRNIAIDASKGRYIAVSDADDLNMPTRLQDQVDFLEAHPEVDVVGSNMYVFNNEGLILGGLINEKTSDSCSLPHNTWRIPLAHPTIMARGEWLRRFRYHEDYFRAEDRELFFRSCRTSRFANIPEFLYAYRDPGWLSPRKLFYTNWQVIVMRWRHRREYGLPVSQVLGFPVLAAGRFFYYCLAALCGKGLMWGHLQQPARTPDFLRDQEWISRCLRHGTMPRSALNP
jgi:glycosyltransferase involved in cell wall biosynthesis